MSLADDIRRFVYRHYLQPAFAEGAVEVSVLKRRGASRYGVREPYAHPVRGCACQKVPEAFRTPALCSDDLNLSPDPFEFFNKF